MREPGYITDVEYTGGYFAHQAPALMCYVAALNGYAAPRVDREFAYCELGCGRGMTSAVLAATHPQARFYACDLNPGHVRYARELAEAGGVGNVTFLERSFAGMLEEELPQFDFITLHGVWSWVPEPVRGEIRAFLKAKLKPSGLAMVSYNAMPGWAPIMPIRRMMHAYADALPGNSIEKVAQAFKYVQHIAENGAAFFATNPAAAGQLKSIGKADPRYVAHEYMTPHGDPFYFPEVAEAMQEIGLAFAGSMHPANNYAEFMVAPQFQSLMQSAPSRTVAETHRDFIANTRFRQDLYAAQPDVPRATPLTLERLEGLAFCLANAPEKLQLAGQSGGVQFDLIGLADAVRATHRVLAQGPSTAKAIHSTLQILKWSAQETARLIQQLVIAGHIVPCPEKRAPGGWHRLSAALLRNALKEKQSATLLVAPGAGGGRYYEIIFATMMEAITQFDEPSAAIESVAGRLTDSGHTLSVKLEGSELRSLSDEEAARHLDALYRVLHDVKSPDRRFLQLIGVL